MHIDIRFVYRCISTCIYNGICKLFSQQLTGRFSPYMRWRRADDHFELEIRKKAVAQRVNRMGKVVLLYQGNLDWRECLSTYRSRDLWRRSLMY